jgi:hypothetical protein
LACQLAAVIDKQQLATVIKGRRFVNVEGWTTLATMLGVTAREVFTVEVEGVYTATVEVGADVGRGMYQPCQCRMWLTG